MLESTCSVSNTDTYELRLLGVTLSLSFSWKDQNGIYFPERQITHKSEHSSDETHSAGSTALLWYLWLLVMTAGIPLVALGVQPDGGPHATGGTETEDEP